MTLKGHRNMLRRRFLLLFVSCLGLGSVTALGQPHTSIAAEPNGWTTGTSMPDVRSAHVAVRLRDGRVLVVGGYNSSGPTTDSWMFDPSSNGGMGSWAAMKPSQSAHPSGATATVAC